MVNSTAQGSPYIIMARRTIEIMLVLVLAWLVAGWFTTPVASIATMSTDDLRTSSGMTSVSVQTLLAMAPFGELRTTVRDITAERDQLVTPSHRVMTLRGTVVAGKDSVAMIIPQPGAKLEIFHVGGSILPGVKLQGVESKRVFIEAGGKTGVLMLAGVKQAGSLPVQGMPPVVSGASNAVRHQNISRNMLNRELNNFPQLLSQARVFPEMREGKNMGFRLSEIVSGSLYDRIGLKNGDVVQTVNGVRIQNPSQAMAMYRRLKGASSVVVQLLRHGQKKTLNYNIR